MQNLLNPNRIFIINTIPIIIMFAVFIGEYQIINSQLGEENIRLWVFFAVSLFVLTLLTAAYAVYSIANKRKLNWQFGLTMFLSYTVFFYLYSYSFEDIIPTNIPRWMLSENLLQYAGTFIMPTLLYGLFILVMQFTKPDKNHKAWINFLIAVGIPTGLYLFTQLVLPFWHNIRFSFKTHFSIILIISATVLFLFFVLRGLYIVINKKSEIFTKYQLAWKIPITILFPLIGLAVNNGQMFGFGDEQGIFGDFNNYWFYILAVINGGLLCLPQLKNVTYRIALFTARSITFAYTLYFFMVFLPFLPLSLLAIIAIGIGILMLTPLALFVIHIDVLNNDFNFLKQHFSKQLLFSASIFGFLLIPIFITISFKKDKRVLNESLEYIYRPNFEKNYSINKNSLKETMKTIHNHKKNRFFSLSESRIPYISSYFSWLVLDNLTLSDSKINKIESIFFNTEKPINNFFRNRQDSVGITNITTQSRYDSTQQAFISNIDLEITNHESLNLSEYQSSINLPTGCFISDYYLYVGERKEYGILSEKKSALWIYTQITNTNRDPGILYYTDNNTVAFRIFPFLGNETRKTGIEFLHKESVTINIDGNNIALGENTQFEKSNSKIAKYKGVHYISENAKKDLPKIRRKPYYHFIIDVSEGDGPNYSEYIKRASKLLDKKIINSNNTIVSLVNTYVKTNNWENTLDKFNQQSFEGGFFLHRALKSVLYNSYKKNDGSYPVIVVVTDSLHLSVTENNLSMPDFTHPENDYFYVLDKEEVLHKHSLNFPLQELGIDSGLLLSDTVLAYPSAKQPIAYIRDNGKASIILQNDSFTIEKKEIKEKDWISGLLLQAKYLSTQLHPKTMADERLGMIKNSFISGIMTPLTSYIVVENEAQKAALKRKQEQVLKSDGLKDTDNESVNMSEPGFYIILILLAIFILYREKKKKQITF